MRTIYLQKDCPADLAASVATIGFFDGVHRGHQFLISHVVETAREEGRQSMIITFDQHPREVLHADYQPRLLTPLQEKLYLLERTGVDVVAVLHFDVALSQLSARDFMHDLLLGRLHVAKLFIGYDHRFGHNRAEGFALPVPFDGDKVVVAAVAFHAHDLRAVVTDFGLAFCT